MIELKNIIDETLNHSIFFDKSDVYEAVRRSYELGLKSNQEKYEQLKSAFESLLKLWGEQGRYNVNKSRMEEDWKKHAGLL